MSNKKTMVAMYAVPPMYPHAYQKETIANAKMIEVWVKQNMVPIQVAGVTYEFIEGRGVLITVTEYLSSRVDRYDLFIADKVEEFRLAFCISAMGDFALEIARVQHGINTPILPVERHGNYRFALGMKVEIHVADDFMPETV